MTQPAPPIPRYSTDLVVIDLEALRQRIETYRQGKAIVDPGLAGR